MRAARERARLRGEQDQLQELHQEEYLQDAWLKGEDHDQEEAEAQAEAVAHAPASVEGEGDPS